MLPFLLPMTCGRPEEEARVRSATVWGEELPGSTSVVSGTSRSTVVTKDEEDGVLASSRFIGLQYASSLLLSPNGDMSLLLTPVMLEEEATLLTHVELMELVPSIVVTFILAFLFFSLSLNKGMRHMQAIVDICVYAVSNG
jgi:hypothetical protein